MVGIGRGGRMKLLRVVLLLVVVPAVLAGVVLASAGPARALDFPDGVGTWQTMSGPAGTGISGVDFVDADHGWARGWYGGVATTDDGGATWTPVVENDPLYVTASTGLAALSASEGWVVVCRHYGDHDEGAVRHTADGGSTWQENATFPLPSSAYSGEIVFADPTHGWVLMAGTIYKTVDAGDTWTQVAGAPKVYALGFTDARHGFAYGDSGPYSGTFAHAWATSDGGDTWRSMPLPASQDGYSSMTFVDADHGFVVLGWGTSFATDDGGLTWAQRGFVSGDHPTIQALDKDHVWAADCMGSVFGSDDGGTTWVLRQTHSSGFWSGAGLEVVGDSAWITGPWVGRTEKDGYSDMRAPVTTFSPPAFINAPATVQLAATDAGSGVDAIWYSVNDAAWQQGDAVDLTIPPTASSGDVIAVRVAAKDKYGNWEQGNSFSVTIDTLPPAIVLSPEDILGYWVNGRATIRVDAYESWNGSGVKDVLATRDGSDWQPFANHSDLVVDAPADHSGDGPHTFQIRAVDQLGNQRDDAERLVAIDTRKPKAAAGYVAKARSRGIGAVRFKISDAKPCSGQCRAIINITTLRGKKLGYLAPDVWFATGRYVTVKFACPLKAGKYKFLIKGTDGAGNATAKSAWNYLVVTAGKGRAVQTVPVALRLLPPTRRAPAALHAQVTEAVGGS